MCPVIWRWTCSPTEVLLCLGLYIPYLSFKYETLVVSKVQYASRYLSRAVSTSICCYLWQLSKGERRTIPCHIDIERATKLLQVDLHLIVTVNRQLWNFVAKKRSVSVKMKMTTWNIRDWKWQWWRTEWLCINSKSEQNDSMKIWCVRLASSMQYNIKQ